MSFLPKRFAVALLLCALPSLPATADVPLAEPGDCAEAAPGASLVRPVVYAPGGPVIGDPALLLGLAAVGAPPSVTAFPSPGALVFPGTGACDKPGSGCSGPIAPGPPRPTGGPPASGTIRELPSRPAPPPGLP